LDQQTTLTAEEIEALAGDSRRGVRELLMRFQRRRKAAEDELKRLEKMLVEENILWNRGLSNIAGVDEAGRGPLAGPVVAAAVVFYPATVIKYLNDSKQLSAKKRENLFEEIIFRSKAYGIGSASSVEIDELNIHQASLLAMRRALDKMKLKPDYILVDGFPLPKCSCNQKAIIGGDARSLTIAAASVLAKVARDRIMQRHHETYPRYAFNRNMGYGTAEHRQAMVKYGLTPEHRRSFKLKED
jgi:ribonuclease HII